MGVKTTGFRRIYGQVGARNGVNLQCFAISAQLGYSLTNLVVTTFQNDLLYSQAHLHASRDDHLDLDVIEFAEKGRGVIATR